MGTKKKQNTFFINMTKWNIANIKEKENKKVTKQERKRQEIGNTNKMETNKIKVMNNCKVIKTE